MSAEHEDDGDDFSDEIALTCQNSALRALLAERSKEPGKHTIDEVRERLGLMTPSLGSGPD